jgi:hypothetical protein
MRGLLLLALTACGHGDSRPAPPPLENHEVADCSDAVDGVWTARVWRDDADEWDEVVLTITRDGDVLAGEIEVTTWDGDRSQAEPPQCPDRSPAISRVVQRGRGRIDGDRFDFQGSAPRRVELPCGVPPTGTYHPDHFTGELDRATERLHTRNDDGSVDDGRPHDFKRTRCRP